MQGGLDGQVQRLQLVEDVLTLWTLCYEVPQGLIISQFCSTTISGCLGRSSEVLECVVMILFLVSLYARWKTATKDLGTNFWGSDLSSLGLLARGKENYVFLFESLWIFFLHNIKTASYGDDLLKTSEGNKIVLTGCIKYVVLLLNSIVLLKAFCYNYIDLKTIQAFCICCCVCMR